MTTARKIAIIALILIVIGALCAGAITQHKAETMPTESNSEEFKPILTFGNNRVYEKVLYSVEDNFFLDMCDKYGEGKFKIYDPDEITYDKIVHRKGTGTVLIERLIGISDSSGDGTILNTEDKRYNYISYKSTLMDFDTGNLIVTYCVYNPDTKYDDDIINRYDFELETIK